MRGLRNLDDGNQKIQDATARRALRVRALKMHALALTLTSCFAAAIYFTA